MRWQDVYIRKIIKGDKDRLGNVRIKYGEHVKIKGRITQWTAEDVNLYGRELTETTRKLLTPYMRFGQDTVIVVDGLSYKIEKVQDLDRFKLVFIKRYNYEI